VPDGPEAFVHEGWPIYAGPDLVYRPDGRKVVILDWKTGDDSDVELQIPPYALYCRTVLGLPFRDEEWFGRVVNLATGEDTTREITRIDVMGAADRVRDSVGVMHSRPPRCNNHTAICARWIGWIGVCRCFGEVQSRLLVSPRIRPFVDLMARSGQFGHLQRCRSTEQQRKRFERRRKLRCFVEREREALLHFVRGCPQQPLALLRRRVGALLHVPNCSP